MGEVCRLINAIVTSDEPTVLALLDDVQNLQEIVHLRHNDGTILSLLIRRGMLHAFDLICRRAYLKIDENYLLAACVSGKQEMVRKLVDYKIGPGLSKVSDSDWTKTIFLSIKCGEKEFFEHGEKSALQVAVDNDDVSSFEELMRLDSQLNTFLFYKEVLVASMVYNNAEKCLALMGRKKVNIAVGAMHACYDAVVKRNAKVFHRAMALQSPVTDLSEIFSKALELAYMDKDWRYTRGLLDKTAYPTTTYYISCEFPVHLLDNDELLSALGAECVGARVDLDLDLGEDIRKNFEAAKRKIGVRTKFEILWAAYCLNIRLDEFLVGAIYRFVAEDMKKVEVKKHSYHVY